MKKRNLRTYIGIPILGLAIAASFAHVIFRDITSSTDDVIELRIAHKELQVGMREAFQYAIDEYQKIHPNVKITQAPVPPRTYPAWYRTQLVGGTAPDIISPEGEISRYFLPLTDLADKPNPYNKGTHLENTPWRDTFFDGLITSYDMTQYTAPGQLFGVMLQTSSMRMYVNKDMLVEVTGSDAPPQNYAELRAIVAKLEEYNARTGRRTIPIASCKPYASYIFDQMSGSQTQKLLLRHKPHMRTWGFFEDIADKVFTYSGTPEFFSALEIMAEVSQMFSPGYQQFTPEDAIAVYLQQRSLMLVAGSWDYAVLLDRVPFDTIVIPIPVPATDDPKYGEFTLGNAAEKVEVSAMLGVTRQSPNANMAADFLQFLTSLPIATEFSNLSKRISATIDVPVPEDLALMAAKTEGEIPGFRVDTILRSGSVINLVNRHIHKITGPEPDVADFARSMDEGIQTAVREDIEIIMRGERTNIEEFDAKIALYYLMHEGTPDRSEWRRNATMQQQAQGRHAGYTRWLKANTN